MMKTMNEKLTFGMILAAAMQLASPVRADVHEGTRWINASTLTIEGRAFSDGKGPFDRLPASAEGRVTPEVWYFSQHTAGMALRFRTDSDFIKVKWNLLEDALDAPNQSRCGKSGFDVYRRAKDGRWKFMCAFSPSQRDGNLGETGWTRGEEGLIHFPLDNGVRSLQVGVATNASFEVVDSGKKPIVWYGVSTTQGIAASRPGMAFPAIVSRRLDIPHVNLGFSGAGQMEMEMCGYVADLEASVYVIDTPGNLNLQLMQERYERFLRELHRRRPKTPIVIADQRIYSSERETRTPMNEYLAEMFARLGKEPGWRLFHVRAESMFPTEVDEVSVDSPDGHPSDLGMLQLADAYQRQIAAAIGVWMAERVAAKLGASRKNPLFVSKDVSWWPKTREMAPEALAELVERDPGFGRVVILGSGDIGLIMARRLTFSGRRCSCASTIWSTGSRATARSPASPLPVRIGDVVIPNVAETGVDVVATANM